MGVINAVFSDAVDTMDCPRCEVEAGDRCIDDKDNPRAIHTERLRDYVDRVGGMDKFKDRVAASGPTVKPKGRFR